MSFIRESRMMDIHDWVLVIFGVLQLGFIAIGIYFKQYLIKKADIRATNENFDKLMTQLSETTEITKSIEGRLGNTAWLIQQKWQIKKDFYIESTMLLNELNECFDEIYRLQLESLKKKSTKNEQRDCDIDNKIDHGFDVISKKYIQLKGKVDLVGVLFLSPSVLDAINTYLKAEKNRTHKIYSGLLGGGNKKEAQQVANEVASFDLYLINQAENCAIARDQLLVEAKRDLDLAWE
jgi:hypothetical protein